MDGSDRLAARVHGRGSIREEDLGRSTAAEVASDLREARGGRLIVIEHGGLYNGCVGRLGEPQV